MTSEWIVATRLTPSLRQSRVNVAGLVSPEHPWLTRPIGWLDRVPCALVQAMAAAVRSLINCSTKNLRVWEKGFRTRTRYL